MSDGILITFEGVEGSGKSTISEKVYQILKKENYPVVLTREPGGAKVSEKIREILLDPNYKLTPEAELFLFEAARSGFIQEVILPNLIQSKIIICDRFYDSTTAYQGYGRGLDLETITALNKIATRGVIPNLTILLDIYPRDGLKRAKQAKELDRIDQEKLDFHKMVWYGYLQIAQKEPERVKIVNASKPLEEVTNNCLEIIKNYLNNHYK